MYDISTHTTHVGGDLRKDRHRQVIFVISTHTTHVGGDIECFEKIKIESISTHTTHVGGDFQVFFWHQILCYISTHTTHVGGDKLFKNGGDEVGGFQLTPPMWVAT